MIDTGTLTAVAKAGEMDEFTVLREYVQVQFLNSFYKNSQIKETYFKGGTALRLVFGSSRFSEDLDFTTRLDKQVIKRGVAEVVKTLQGELPKLGFKEMKTVQGYSIKLYLPTELSRQDLTVKLDFSMREKVLDPQVSPIETNLPVAVVSLVEHISDEEILAEKLRAIWSRRKGRDLFDLWFLLAKKVVMRQDIIEKKFEIDKAKFSVVELKKRINSWGEKDIDGDLRKFLPASQRRIIPELKRLCLEKLP